MSNYCWNGKCVKTKPSLPLYTVKGTQTSAVLPERHERSKHFFLEIRMMGNKYFNLFQTWNSLIYTARSLFFFQGRLFFPLKKRLKLSKHWLPGLKCKRSRRFLPPSLSWLTFFPRTSQCYNFFNTVTKHKPLLNIFYIDVAFSELDWFMGD